MGSIGVGAPQSSITTSASSPRADSTSAAQMETLEPQTLSSTRFLRGPGDLYYRDEDLYHTHWLALDMTHNCGDDGPWAHTCGDDGPWAHNCGDDGSLGLQLWR